MEGKILISKDQIKERIQKLADQINNDYKNESSLLAIGILCGAFMFFADVIRKIKIPLGIDFMMISSYAGTDSTQQIKINKNITHPVKGMNILVIEDIIDTGITLKFIKESILKMKPKSLKVCALLDKKERRVIDIEADYVGFNIPNHFVIGYGMDYDEKYRNLPHIEIFEGGMKS